MHLKTEPKALLGQIHDLFLTETSVDLKQNQGWDKTTKIGLHTKGMSKPVDTPSQEQEVLPGASFPC